MQLTKRTISILTILAGLAVVLAACQTASNPATTTGTGMGQGMGMGNNSMMSRHMASIPQEFAGLANPVSADAASIQRGEEIYTTYCVVCHGEGGMGDGPSAVNLDPPPAPVAHTSQMMGDDYLFWRITEGGVPFETAMIPFGGVLDEQARWDVINYIRALGSGSMGMHDGNGMGNMQKVQNEAVQRAEMLAQAVEQGVITKDEAELFEMVHSAMDAGLMAQRGGPMTGNAANALEELVASGTITQEQADAFSEIHGRLEAAGLME